MHGNGVIHIHDAYAYHFGMHLGDTSHEKQEIEEDDEEMTITKKSTHTRICVSSDIHISTNESISREKITRNAENTFNHSKR